MTFPRQHRAFTLIELLAVITLIGILSAILIPIVGTIREKGHVTVCANNLRQIGSAFTTYQIEHQGYWPAIGTSGGGSSAVTEWFKSGLFEYLSDGVAFDDYPFAKKGSGNILAPFNNSPLYCPAVDPEDNVKPYGVNLWLWQGQLARPIKALSLPTPANTMLAADKDGNLSYINGPTSIVSNRQAIMSDRHDGAANILYCDGHVSSMTYNEILEKHQAILDPFWSWRALPQPTVN